MLLLVALHTLSGLVMAWHGSPRPAINMIWQWLGFGIGFLMVCQLVRTGAECRAICAVMIVLAASASLLVLPSLLLLVTLAPQQGSWD